MTRRGTLNIQPAKTLSRVMLTVVPVAGQAATTSSERWPTPSSSTATCLKMVLTAESKSPYKEARRTAQPHRKTKSP
jgi:hypothetical protein